LQLKSHFDNPLVEQRELLESKRVCLVDDKSVIRVSGQDRLTWLHAMLSQNLANLKPGQSADALLLDANGRVEENIQIIDDGENSWLIVLAEHAEKLLKWFDQMIFRSKVEVSRVDDLAIVASFGQPLAGSAISNEQQLVWQDPWMSDPVGSVRYAATDGRNKRGAWNFFLSLVSKASLDDVLADKPQAGTLALEALRVAAHRPSQPNEIDDKTLPHELDWLSSAVHLSKGCYRGQEAVAKVHNLGHPPRRLTLLHLDGSGHSLAMAGDKVFVSGTDGEVGRITSIGQHFELGPIALALIGRNVDESDALFVKTEGGEISANQETIVPPTAGAAANMKEKRANLMGK
jgi:tRNA-modifying protein YgfZ